MLREHGQRRISKEINTYDHSRPFRQLTDADIIRENSKRCPGVDWSCSGGHYESAWPVCYLVRGLAASGHLICQHNRLPRTSVLVAGWYIKNLWLYLIHIIEIYDRTR